MAEVRSLWRISSGMGTHRVCRCEGDIMNRPSQWNDAVYTLIVKAMARVGWWLQRPLIRLQRESMTTVTQYPYDSDAEQSDSPVSQSCAHEHVTEPVWNGGNYGNHGTQRCLDCGAWKDSYSDWSPPTSIGLVGRRMDESARVGFDDGPMFSKACAARMHEFCSYEGLGCGCECHKRQDAAVDEYLDDLDERLGLRTLDTSTDEIKKWPKIELRGTEPIETIKPVTLEQLGEWERQRKAERVGDELTPDEINEYLEHGNLPNEAERLERIRLEQRARGLSEFAAMERLEQPSTMSPEAPQAPVSAADDEDEWKCLYCGKHVERTAQHSRFIRRYNALTNRYETVQAWCNNGHWGLWKHDVANDAR